MMAILSAFASTQLAQLAQARFAGKYHGFEEHGGSA
jgi:hypothetical protein